MAVSGWHAVAALLGKHAVLVHPQCRGSTLSCAAALSVAGYRPVLITNSASALFMQLVCGSVHGRLKHQSLPCCSWGLPYLRCGCQRGGTRVLSTSYAPATSCSTCAWWRPPWCTTGACTRCWPGAMPQEAVATCDRQELPIHAGLSQVSMGHDTDMTLSSCSARESYAVGIWEVEIVSPGTSCQCAQQLCAAQREPLRSPSS